MDKCSNHDEFVKTINALTTSIAVLNANFTQVRDKITAHIDDGEKQGGFRDRLVIVEHNQRNVVMDKIKELGDEVKRSQKNMIYYCLLSGIIGGLLGKVTPSFVELIAKTITLVSWIR